MQGDQNEYHLVRLAWRNIAWHIAWFNVWLGVLMNAYELADELENAPVYMSVEGDAARMLRQQADRIATLEKESDSYMVEALNNTLNLERNHNEKAYKELYDFCKQQADRISSLESQLKVNQECSSMTNAEPVAWWMKANDPDLTCPDYLTLDKPTRQQKVSHSAIPLYTTPQTKPLQELTENECEAIINRHNWFAKSWAEMAKEIHDEILRKSGIK